MNRGKKRNRNSGSVKFLAACSGLLIFDQLVLPIQHIGPIPIKLSYVILLLPFVASHLFPGLTKTEKSDLRRLWRIVVALIVVLSLGEIVFYAKFGTIDFPVFLRNIGSFVFMGFAFALGLRVRCISVKWVGFVFVTYVALHAIVTHTDVHIPIYKSNSEKIERLVERTGKSYEALKNIKVPGIQSNPNGSALIFNVLLATLVALRLRGKADGMPPGIFLLVILGGSVVIADLGSRNQAGAYILILGAALVATIKHSPKKGGAITTLWILGMAAFLALFYVQSQKAIITESRLVERIEETGTGEKNNSLLRPLIYFETAFDRFGTSPLVGAGVSVGSEYPFSKTVEKYHNDWLRVGASGGLAGLGLLITLVFTVWRSCAVLTIPFFLPGLTNTFFLNYAAVIVIFFASGVLWRSRSCVKGGPRAAQGSAGSRLRPRSIGKRRVST